MLVALVVMLLGMVAETLWMDSARVFSVTGRSRARWALNNFVMAWTWPIELLFYIINRVVPQKMLDEIERDL